MKTPLLRSALLGGLVSLALSQTASAIAIIDFGPATMGATDTSVSVFADNLGGKFVANFDVLINFAASLHLDGATPVMFDNEAAFGGAGLVFDGTNNQTATGIEGYSISFLTGAGDNNPLFAPLQNGTKVKLFTLEFQNNPTGAPLNLSSLSAPKCLKDPQQLVDPNAILIPACQPSTSVPEPSTLPLMAVGLLGLLAGIARRRRGLVGSV